MKNNIVFIDSNLNDSNILLSALNTETHGILYNYDTTRNEILQQIKFEFEGKNILRIAICCHKGFNIFLENDFFFNIDTYTSEIHKNANTQFILDLLKTYNVSNIDYLACNSLQYDSWKKYYDFIESQSEGVTVGASEDNTGNIKYGGNWVMENTSEQVDNIYFNEGLEYYKFTLGVVLNGIIYSDSSYTTATGIDSGALQSDLQHIVLHENCTTISDNCFYPNSRSVEIQSIIGINVTSIGTAAIAICTNLTYVIFPKLEQVGLLAFTKTPIKFIHGSNLNLIGDEAFKTTNLVTMKIPLIIDMPEWFQGKPNLIFLDMSNMINVTHSRSEDSYFLYGTSSLVSIKINYFGFSNNLALGINSFGNSCKKIYSDYNGNKYKYTFTDTSSLKSTLDIRNASDVNHVSKLWIPIDPLEINSIVVSDLVPDTTYTFEKHITINFLNMEPEFFEIIKQLPEYIFSFNDNNFDIINISYDTTSSDLSINIIANTFPNKTVKLHYDFANYIDTTISGEIIVYTPIPEPKLITSNNGTSVVLSPISKKIELFDSTGNLEHIINTNDNVISGISVNFDENLLVVGLPIESNNHNIKSYQVNDGFEIYNINEKYLSLDYSELFIHLSSDGTLMIPYLNSFNQLIITEYESIYALNHKALSISFDDANIIYPDLSINFTIELTTNDVSLSLIKNYLSLNNNPNIVYINDNSLFLDNYGFTLHGTIETFVDIDTKGVQIFYKDFSSNLFDINTIQDLSFHLFQFDSSLVTYENYQTNNITLEINRRDLTLLDISNSLSIDPSYCGKIIDISGSEKHWNILFQPNLFINETNANLKFHYTGVISYIDASMTIPFAIDTLQKIIDASLNPKSIFAENISSFFNVKFRIPYDTPNTKPNISISPSYISFVSNNNDISGDSWTGTIKRFENKNLLYNNINFNYDGIDISLSFNVAENPELIIGPREIADYIECKGIKITSTSTSESFTITEIQITDYDSNTLLLNSDAVYEYSGNIINGTPSNILDSNPSTTCTLEALSNSFFKITFNYSTRKIKSIKIYASQSVNIELLGEGPSYKTIANLGIVNIDISGTVNIASASTQSTILRRIQNISIDVSNIIYPETSCNFEVLFSKNDLSLNDISGNIEIIPSNIGTISNLELIYSGFKMIGKISANSLTKNLTTILKYFETDDISFQTEPFTIYNYPPFQILNYSLTPNNIIGLNDSSSNLHIEFNIPIPNDVSLNDYITIDPSYIVILDKLITVDGGFNWNGTIAKKSYMNKLRNKCQINYTNYNILDLNDNYLSVSAELIFNVLENNSVLKWDKKYDTVINETFNKSAILSPNGKILALLSGEDVKIYHAQLDYTWNLYLQAYLGNCLALCDKRIAIANNSSLRIYEYENPNWIQVGSSINVSNISKLAISNDGNRVSFVHDVSSIAIYNYTNNEWNMMNINTTGNDVKFSPNGLLLGVGILESSNQNFSDVVLYECAQDTINWTLKV